MRRLAVVVLAAGRGERFGGPKQVALLDGRPLIAHVLAAVSDARPRLAAIEDVVAVTGFGADEVEAAVRDAAAGLSVPVRAVRNPDPGRGLASSLQAGIAALGPAIDGALVALADQPRLSPAVVAALADAWAAGDAQVVAARYAHGAARNPVLLGRPSWPLVATLTGDRGLGPLLDADPGLALVVDVPGDNPDVDVPADLAELGGN